MTKACMLKSSRSVDGLAIEQFGGGGKKAKDFLEVLRPWLLTPAMVFFFPLATFKPFSIMILFEQGNGLA